MKRVAEIIEDLGGVAETAAGLGSPYQTVHSWIARGFPAARCIEIRDFAKSKGVKLTVDEILAAKSEGAALA